MEADILEIRIMICAIIQKVFFSSKDGTNVKFHCLVIEGTSSQALLCILKIEYKMI